MLGLPPGSPGPLGELSGCLRAGPWLWSRGGPCPAWPACSCLLRSEQSWFPASCQHVSGQAAVVSGPHVRPLTLGFAT